MSALEHIRLRGKPTNCERCGHIWPQDPIWEVECPKCHGKGWCGRPSGHYGPAFTPHAIRDLYATVAGKFLHIDPRTGDFCANGIKPWEEERILATCKEWKIDRNQLPPPTTREQWLHILKLSAASPAAPTCTKPKPKQSARSPQSAAPSKSASRTATSTSSHPPTILAHPLRSGTDDGASGSVLILPMPDGLVQQNLFPGF